jgi:hypothetical protein
MRTWIKVSMVGWLAVLIMAPALMMSLLPAAAGATTYYFDMDSDDGHPGTFYPEPGYTSVKVTTIYGAQPYGWAVSPSGQRDRGTPTNLLRDLHFDSSDKTFRAGYGSGTYGVTLYFRDDLWPHDFIEVFAEGSLTPVATVDSLPKLTTVTRTFNVTVNDGVLDLRFHNNTSSGSDVNWVINGIVLNYVPLPSTVLLLGSGLVGLGLWRHRRKGQKQ